MTRPFTIAELKAMNLRTFRFGTAPRATVKEFGWDTLTLDRVASEHSATICERMRKARMRLVETEGRG